MEPDKIKEIAESLRASKNTESSLTTETQLEAKAEEAPAETTEKPTEEVVKKEEVKTEAPAEKPQVDNSKYETEIAELKKQLESKVNKTGNKVIDRLLELHEQGVHLESEDDLMLAYRPLDNVDTKNLEVSMGLLVESLMKEKGYSREDAQEELEYEYPHLFDDSETDTKEYKANERKFTREANEYLQRLKEKQKSLSIPKPEQKQIATPDVQSLFNQFLQENQNKKVKAREELANSITQGKDKVSFNIDGVDFQYEPSAETIDKIKKDFIKIDDIGTNYVNADGSINDRGLFDLLLFRHEASNILKAYGDMRASQGSKQTIKEEIKNTDFDTKKPASVKGLPVPDNHPLAGAIKALRGIS